MEFEISFSLLVIIAVTITFMIKLLNLFKKSNSNPKFPPPGPWKIPLIGNLLSVVSRQPPHVVLRDLARKHGPFMHLQLGEVSALVISSPQLAKEIMVKNDISFADRPENQASKLIVYNSTDLVFSRYGSYWRQLRKLCNLELLSAKKVQSFSYIREEEANLMIKSIVSSSGSPINLTEKIFTLTNTVISRASFGKIPKDQDLLLQALQETIDVASGFGIVDMFPSYKLLHSITGMSNKMAKIHQFVDKVFDNIIAEHQKDRENRKGGVDEEGLLDILLRLKDSGDLECPISMDNIKAVLFDMLTAGTDTSSSTVEWAVCELLRNPEMLEKAQAEVREACKGKSLLQESDFQGLKYLKMVVKETMRLHPAGPLMLPRECRESCEINGYVIPLKTKVIINGWAIGRDPEYWHDPERFLPERFENSNIDYTGKYFEYLPFGSGRRMCPGMTFGVANMEIILFNLLYHFDWKLPGGMKPEDLDMSETLGVACRRKDNLYLIATPYTPL